MADNADRQLASVTWIKVIICIFMIVALVIIIVLAIALSKSKTLRDSNPALATGVGYGSAVLIAAYNGNAVGYNPDSGALEVAKINPPAGPPLPVTYSSYQVAQLFSQDPTKTVIRNGDKVRVYFPQVGAWYVSKDSYVAGKFDDASDVVVNIADGSDNQRLPNDGVGSSTFVQLYEKSADANDKTYQLLSQGGKVQLVPAGVFGSNGIGGP